MENVVTEGTAKNLQKQLFFIFFCAEWALVWEPA